jgi:hypothetical protein
MKKDLNGPMAMVEKNLKYLKQSQINYEKWDRCIDLAPNSRVYAASWYLDRTAVNWNALVWGDYEFVMPLPFKKKLGIRYLYQPLYCQQLGIFPSPPVEVATAFYQKIRKIFRFSDMQLNALNIPPNKLAGFYFSPRRNFLLHLNTDYEFIFSAYSGNTKRNIARAGKNRLNFVEGISMEDFLEFKKKNLVLKLSEKSIQKIKSIIAYSQYKGFGEIAGVYTPGNELCAAVFFCRWKDRIIYLNATSSLEGKELRAMFHLMDCFLKNSAGKNLTLDFEGSMIPGVARFFAGFGATPETYYRMQSFKLPALFKWMKGKWK